jgi:hypothetical protein
MQLRIILCVLLTVISLPSRAADTTTPEFEQEYKSEYDTSWYVGAAYGQFTYSQNNQQDFTMTDRRLIIGKQLNRVFALELHAGNSSSDTQLVSAVSTTIKVDNYVAGFLKINATYAFEDWDYNRLRLFALLGGTHTQATTTDSVNSRDGSQNSFSAGLGIEIFRDNVGIQLGYTRYVNGSSINNDYTLDSLYLGVIYQFGSN